MSLTAKEAFKATAHETTVRGRETMLQEFDRTSKRSSTGVIREVWVLLWIRRFGSKMLALDSRTSMHINDPA